MVGSPSAIEGRSVARQSLLDDLVPLRGTTDLIEEHQLIQETLREVLAVHASTHRQDILNRFESARQRTEHDDSAAHWHELQLEEKAINILSRSCAVELENSALTVQIKDLLRAQGIQHPDNLPQTPVFTEHNLEVITNVDGLYASLAAAFWASNAAQQKEILMRERDWKCHQEEIQKKRCYEVITARDKKYETDTRQLKLRLERSQSELTQQKQLVHVLRARQEHDTAVQDILEELQHQTEEIAPTMQKTEQRHEALQQELQNAQLGFAQQVAVMQDVHAQVSVLGEVKHYKELLEKSQEETACVKKQLQEAQQHALETREADAAAGQALQKEQAQLLKGLQDQLANLQADRSAAQELCDKERQATARVKEQLQQAQADALEARKADAAAGQAVQREQAQVLQDLREQMAHLQAARNAGEERAVKAEKEAAELRDQLQSLKRDAQTAQAATVRADTVAEQERLFSAHKEWISQQLQPLLQPPQPLSAPADQTAGQPVPVHRDAGADTEAAMPTGEGPAGASPVQPLTADFLSDEEGNAADGAAAYADVGRLAQALSGRGQNTAAAPVAEEREQVATGAQRDKNEPDTERVTHDTKRQGRPLKSRAAAAGSSAAAAGSSAADALKAVKRRVPRRSAGAPLRGGKRGRGGTQRASSPQTADKGSPVEAAGSPPQKRKRSKGRAAAAAAGGPPAEPREPSPGPVDAQPAKVQDSDDVEVDRTEGVSAAMPRRVLRARKPGLVMADGASDECDVGTGSEASEAQSCGNRGQAKGRRTSGVKQVENARKKLPMTDIQKACTKPSATSPLLLPGSFGSPRAMRMGDARVGEQPAAAGNESPLAVPADGEACISPRSDGGTRAAAVTWQDPKSTEFKPPARTRPALAERPCSISERNVTGQRGTLGVHSVVGSQAGDEAPVRMPNSLRDPETYGIVRNPMAAMTSKVMEATKASRQKNTMSWGEKLAVKASERLRLGRTGYSSARVLSQSLSNSCVDAPTNELFPNGYKRTTLRH